MIIGGVMVAAAAAAWKGGTWRGNTDVSQQMMNLMVGAIGGLVLGVVIVVAIKAMGGNLDP
ncbi:hypothetical protein OAG71_04230 [bacterium]|nr:hypothetical protein [bacterium]